MMKFKKKMSILMTRDKEKYYILNGSRLFVVNETAARILQYCNGSNTEEDIVKNMLKKYPDATIENVKQDVKELITFFQKASLIDTIS